MQGVLSFTSENGAVDYSVLEALESSTFTNEIDNGGTEAVFDVEKSGEKDIDGLLMGTKWLDTTITYSFPDALDDYIVAQYGFLENHEWSEFSELQVDAAEYWLGEIASFTGLTFVELDDTEGSAYEDQEATIRFSNSDDAGAGAYAFAPGAFDRIEENHSMGGDVFVGGLGVNPTFGSLDFRILGHELGHAFGLGHTFSNDNGYGAVSEENQTMEWSVMGYDISYDDDNDTYNDVSDVVANFDISHFYDGGYAQTYMRGDIAALQHLYGANYEYNDENTTYTVDLETGEFFVDGVSQGNGDGNVIFRTVWDGGGNDTFDFSSLSTHLDVDLRAGAGIDLDAGGHDNRAWVGDGGWDEYTYVESHIYMSLLHDDNEASLIENATGGTGNDTLTGNSAKNSLDSGAGHDEVHGDGGADTLVGGDGDDILHGDGGWDDLYGDQGEDSLFGGDGNDYLSGGDGKDLLEGGDRHDDMFGGNGADTLLGGSGHDELDGGQGWDDLYGGTGNDMVFGNRGRDDLFGGEGSDTLHGGNGNDELSGGDGNDVLVGGAGADEFFFNLNGNEGHDVILDFSVGKDAIVFEGYAADLEHSYEDEGVVLSWGGGENSVLVEGVTALADLSLDYDFG